ncbi:MAG TPA: alkaline phosphatase family protein [Verrucomicrobiae bacterium]|nr:alkaline phosphatase family protein [Verrucomicrobiae bacterium]
MMLSRILAAVIFTAAVAQAAITLAAWNDGGPPPKLILQITVDQLRGDLPGRYLDRMGEGGFRYLMQHGVWYANAHHAHANTETVVGHTTLATGADPAAHGMVANVWLDRKTGKLAYNTQDSRYRVLTPGADVDKANELDPTQKLASTDGRSPAAILVSTFSDELAMRYAGRSKIFGVSIKDRGAVPLAGHAGKAFWFSKTTGEFVSSTFYYDRYPAWVNEWNQKKLAATYSGKSWALLHERSTYLFGSADDKAWETDFEGYGRTFPHPFGKSSDKHFTTLLTISPAGDELTLDFAEALIDREELGRHDVPDYLSISFSSTDYVGHIFGPSSLESEDNLLRLDRTMAALLSYVDKRIGLANTLIVLSADHGAPEAPGYLNTLGIGARFLRPEQWDQEPAIAALKKKFGVGKELIQMYEHPYVYLNQDVIREKGFDEGAVERAVAGELMKLDGIALAISSTALRENNLPSTRIINTVLRNFNPQRSGDIFVVFESHSFLREADGLPAASSHGSPWRYDTFVPVIFAGGSLQPRSIYREIETVDVAPTLAAIVGAKPPSGARGAPLIEVLQDRR